RRLFQEPDPKSGFQLSPELQKPKMEWPLEDEQRHNEQEHCAEGSQALSGQVKVEGKVEEAAKQQRLDDDAGSRKRRKHRQSNRDQEALLPHDAPKSSHRV